MGKYTFNPFQGHLEFNQDGVDTKSILKSDGGYEFTGGFADRASGQTGASELGTTVTYTQAMVDSDQWMRFGFSTLAQQNNDAPYWTRTNLDHAPGSGSTEYIGVGQFSGHYMPKGCSKLFEFDSANNTSYNDEVSGDSTLNYTAADGSYDFTQCRVGDFLLCRFDFNAVALVPNTNLEIALIWQTRDKTTLNPTFTFALTTQPIYFGQGTVGKTFLNRPTITAYFASDEDVYARALPAIKCDNPIEIQPLTTLVTIQR